jgi:hypothetical protein
MRRQQSVEKSRLQTAPPASRSGLFLAVEVVVDPEAN